MSTSSDAAHAAATVDFLAALDHFPLGDSDEHPHGALADDESSNLHASRGSELHWALSSSHLSAGSSSAAHDADSGSSADDKSEGKKTRAKSREPMRNVSRERKRAELAMLREEAVALERQRNLLMLKRKHQAEFAPPVDTVEQWKRAAETEREVRVRAEAENQRLVTMLQHQMGLSQTLESLLRKRVRVNEGRDDESFTIIDSRLHCDTTIGMLHAQFVRDIQRLYNTGIDRIFDGTTWSNGIAEIGRSMIQEIRPDSCSKASTVEMRDTRHIPFEFKRVVEATWRCALEPFIEQNRIIESYGSAENQIAIKYLGSAPGHLPRQDKLTAVLVMQKFDEPDRTVHIWRVMSSASEDKHANVFEQAFSDETGWIITERVPEGIPGLEPGTAVVRMVAQLTPIGAHADTSTNTNGRVHSDDFHDLVIEATRDDMLALGDAIGNLLLDESLGM